MTDLAEHRAERESAGETERPREPDVVRKQRPIAAAQAEAVPTDEWVRYIRRQLDKRERLMTDAIADVIAPIEKKHRAALDALRAEVALLKSEVAELRAEAKLRGSLDDLQARLAKLETPPRLKAAG